MSQKTNKTQEQVQENPTVEAQEQVQENPTVEAQEQVQEKSWTVKVTSNPDFCGVGAGGVQFANGQAVIKSERMANWFREHDGYTVE